MVANAIFFVGQWVVTPDRSQRRLPHAAVTPDRPNHGHILTAVDDERETTTEDQLQSTLPWKASAE